MANLIKVMSSSVFLMLVSSLTFAEVEPGLLEGKGSYEISDIIYDLMQEDGATTIPWSHMSNSDIAWTTDGYDSDGETTVRHGFLRINILGEKSTVLKRNKRELGWSISYISTGVPKFGANYAFLAPGGPGVSKCFGSLFEMCSFDIIDSLRENENLETEVICSSETFRENDVYLISSEGKEPSVIIIETNGGSGGSHSKLLMTIGDEVLNNSDLCAPRY
ncbi:MULTISPECIES: hypothetical protein [Halomonadaceae]|nr:MULTISPECIES: hypothetical protein [Halomonas]